MFGMGWQELVIVMGVMVLLFGNRLPSVMRNIGRGANELKKGLNECLDETL